jgi:carbon monoxide dehydrogenase subunit G
LEKVHSVVEIAATPETVYATLTNTSYIIKIFRDAVSVDIDPPGNSVVGQRYHLVGKAGRRKLDIYLEVAELVPNRKVITVQRPGGLFKSFESAIVLDAEGEGTSVLTSFDYELSMGYLGKVFNMVLLERLVSDNLKAYSRNLKEICELLPLPK